MRIRDFKTEAVSSIAVVLENNDRIALGIEMHNVNEFLLAKDIDKAYNETPFDQRKNFGKHPSPEMIKELEDKALESLQKIQSFMNTIAIYPSKSNVFADSKEIQHFE